MNEIEIELDSIDPQDFFTNENLSSIRSHFPKLKMIQRGDLLKVLGEKKSLNDFNKKFKYLTNYYLEFNSLNPNVIDEIVFNDIMYNGNNKSTLILHGVGGKPILAKTKNQKILVDKLNKKQLVFAIGPAGTGKTFLAVAIALTMLLDKKIERIILSRPAVEAGERLGFLPGDMKEKVDPYLRPLYDSLYDLFDFEKIQRMIEIGDIEIAPLAFMRGRTLKNSFAILDEAQNATDTQIKMFLTRIGENSKIVVNGDPSQIDLPNKGLSGLNRSKKLLGHLKEISVVDFDHSDVVRHPLVSKIVKAYSDQKND